LIAYLVGSIKVVHLKLLTMLPTLYHFLYWHFTSTVAQCSCYPGPNVPKPVSLDSYRPISATHLLSQLAERHFVVNCLLPAVDNELINDQFAHWQHNFCTRGGDVPLIPRGERTMQEVITNFQYILLHTQHTIWPHLTSWQTEQDSLWTEQLLYILYSCTMGIHSSIHSSDEVQQKRPQYKLINLLKVETIPCKVH